MSCTSTVTERSSSPRSQHCKHKYPARLTPKLYLKSTALAHAQHLLLARIHPLMSPLAGVARIHPLMSPRAGVARRPHHPPVGVRNPHCLQGSVGLFVLIFFSFSFFFFFFFVLFVFPWRVSREEEERAFNERYQEAASSPTIAPARA